MAKRYFDGVKHTINYALFRPSPPLSLIEHIVSKTKHKDLAVDVGCGSGQSTNLLAPLFKRVVGLDVSESQIRVAEAQKSADLCPNVEFRVGQSEVLPFEDNSVDLVTCCQAIHWFDIPKFYQDVNRVLRPKGGVLAVYGYHLTGPAPNAGLNKDQIKGLEDLRNNIFNEIIGKYWDPERKLVDEGYTTIPPIPYSQAERCDDYFVEVNASLEDFAGYIQTWSGFQKFQATEGDEKAEQVIKDFLQQ